MAALVARTRRVSLSSLKSYTCIRKRIFTEILQSLSYTLDASRTVIPLSENDYVSPEFYNRNPRNLERLRIAYKREGWEIEDPKKRTNYWHKLILDRTQNHITARIEHVSGRTVVTASTREWCIKKQLYSAKDVAACENIGRVLAQRCLESGITEVFSSFAEKDKSSSKVESFLRAVKDGGLHLEEPERFATPSPSSGYKEEKPWEVFEEDVPISSTDVDESKAVEND